MRAAVFHGPGRFAVEDRPDPVPGPGQVLVAVHYSGICGTDLRYTTTPPHEIPPQGVIIGHEFSGQIVGVGPGVDPSRISEGTAVMHVLPCKVCALCRAGKTNLCLTPTEKYGLGKLPGGMAELVAVNTETAVSLGDIDTRRGALVEPLAVAEQAVRLSGVSADDTVLVIGCGPIGLLMLAVLQWQGVRTIVASELVSARREDARNLGLEHVLDPSSIDLDREVRKLTSPLGVNVVFECTGNSVAFGQAFGLLIPGGTLMVVGVQDKAVATIPQGLIAYSQLAIRGSRAYGNYDRAIALMREGLDVTHLISSVRPLEGLQRSIEDLSAGAARKILVAPQTRGAA